LRGNFPVVEVRPSFRPFQKYEAVFWIVGHNRASDQIPVSVKWSAGPLFGTIRVDAKQDQRFAGSFAYFGPMLIQVTLTFADAEEQAYVYARFPSGTEL
jgi:hypothetical protein